MILNVLLVQHVSIIDTDIEHFFPKKTTELSHPSDSITDSRYLFIVSKDGTLIELLEDKQLLQNQIKLPDNPDVTLAFFDKTNQSELIANLPPHSYMGTPIVGSLLSDEFMQDMQSYLWIFIPILLPLILLMTSVRYLLNVVNEVLVFSVLILGSIVFWPIQLNSAYLLSLLFIYIYVFTLINQIYYNKTPIRKLSISLAASLITTWLSALLLSISGFGIISDFGTALMIWIGLLSFYIGIRVTLFKESKHDLKWFTFKAPPFISLKKITAITFFSLIGLLLVQPSNINLNPLSLSSSHHDIAEFEKNHSLSQPVLLAIQAKDCSFRTLECNLQLHELQDSLKQKIHLKSQPVLDLDTLYLNLMEEPFTAVTPAKFAQFKLALDLFSNDSILYSADYKTAYFMVAVSIMEPIKELIGLLQEINQVNQQKTNFMIVPQGHLAKVANYQQTFIEEMLESMTLIFLLLALLFTLFYMSPRVLISLLPAIISVGLLISLHALLKIDLSVMTMIALILFIGLITDNLIHILITYKILTQGCFKVVYKPIILSNTIMIISLFFMAFITEGFLKAFGMELALLLSFHLWLMIYLLPTLFKRFIPRAKV